MRVTERYIRKVLRKVEAQRVVHTKVHGRGMPVLEIENAVVDTDDDRLACAIHTCRLRGWIELYRNGMGIKPGNSSVEDSSRTFFPNRLTAEGWAVLNATAWWTLAIFVVAAATLLATLVGIGVSAIVNQ